MFLFAADDLIAIYGWRLEIKESIRMDGKYRKTAKSSRE